MRRPDVVLAAEAPIAEPVALSLTLVVDGIPYALIPQQHEIAAWQAARGAIVLAAAQRSLAERPSDGPERSLARAAVESASRNLSEYLRALVGGAA